MKSFSQQLAVYQQYHAKRMTLLTHFIGVPLLVFAALIFLGWFHFAIPWLATVAAILYYFFLDKLLAAGVAVVLLLLTFFSQFYSQPRITVYSVVFVIILLLIGTAAIAVGHFYETKKPTPSQVFSFALLAPMLLFAELMFALGYREDLR